MYIEPNSVITLVKGVPFNNTYEHTIKFDSLQQQLEYFSNKETLKLQDTQYGRGGDGLFRIAVPIGLARKYNYMMFKNNYNSLSDDKTYFAFITSVEYENNETSIITFEIDVMQTWMFDYEHRECIVDREHTVTDDYFEHLEPEPVEPTNYVFDEQYLAQPDNAEGLDVLNMQEPCIVLTVATGDYPGDVSFPLKDIWAYAPTTMYEQLYCLPPSNYNGTPNICWTVILRYQRTSPADLVFLFTNILNNNGNITSAGFTVFPKSLSYVNFTTAENNFYNPHLPGADGTPNVSFPYYAVMSEVVDRRIVTTTIPIKKEYYYSDLTVKNKKLFSSPYRIVKMFNNDSSVTLQPELMADNDRLTNELTLYEFGSYVPDLNLLYIPKYLGYSTLRDMDIIDGDFLSAPLCLEKSVLIKNTAQIPYSGDSFSRWLSSDGLSYGIRSLTGIISSGISGARGGGVAGALLGVGTSTLNSLADLSSQQRKQDFGGGNISSSILNAMSRCGLLVVSYKPIKENVLEIDNFFTRYGYACNKLKVPNIIIDRLNYCYTKTKNATLVGNVPNDDLQKITTIFNNGITHWKPTATVGDYN